jgi:hypothetical protein
MAKKRNLRETPPDQTLRRIDVCLNQTDRKRLSSKTDALLALFEDIARRWSAWSAGTPITSICTSWGRAAGAAAQVEVEMTRLGLEPDPPGIRHVQGGNEVVAIADLREWLLGVRDHTPGWGVQMNGCWGHPECSRELINTWLPSLRGIAADLRAAISPPPECKPRWDRNTRQLWYGDAICTQFKRAAPRQELVFEAFEEMGWPERIDDPLPQSKLANTIKDIQDRLRQCPINFERDGQKGIVWRKRI